MGIQEILAAKKAKQAAEAMQQPAQTVHVPEVEAKPTATEQNNPANPGQPIQEKPAVGPVYPTHDANGKPLSGFHLIQARKKADAEWALKNQGIVNVPKEVQVQAPALEDAKAEDIPTPRIVEDVQATTAMSGSGVNGTTTESEQAYADLKPKLDALVGMSEDNLKTAMQDLKRALMQNPNAVALMLPSDIGQMVIALRKMTGVELEAAKAKTTGSKSKAKKEPILTAEALEAAWQEL